MSAQTKSSQQGAYNQPQGSIQNVSMPMMSNFNFDPNAQLSSGNGQQPLPQVYVDPETIQQQKESSIAMIDSQAKIAKDRTKAEYDSQVQSVSMRAEIETQNAVSAIEQAKYQALFALDQQHQQRKLEIEQRSQEQRLQIEATSSQLIMQAQQQKLQKEMEEKLAKLQANMPPHMHGNQPSMFGTHTNLNGGTTSFSGFQFFNPYSYTTTTQHAPSKGN